MLVCSFFRWVGKKNEIHGLHNRRMGHFFLVYSQNCDEKLWRISVTKTKLWRNSVTNSHSDGNCDGIPSEIVMGPSPFVTDFITIFKQFLQYHHPPKIVTEFSVIISVTISVIIGNVLSQCPIRHKSPSQIKLWPVKLWWTVFRHNLYFSVTIFWFFRHNLLFFL